VTEKHKYVAEKAQICGQKAQICGWKTRNWVLRICGQRFGATVRAAGPESSATHWYQDVAPTQEFYFSSSHLQSMMVIDYRCEFPQVEVTTSNHDWQILMWLLCLNMWVRKFE
jgi:hypothetical protein